MSFYRRTKLAYLILIQLALKYTKALSIGFIIGFILTITFWQFFPFLKQYIFTPIDRIGVVGVYTPTTLPLTIQQYISQGLTATQADGSVLPALAESWEATDSGKTYIFHLHSNFVWHNTKPVTAYDVNYNIRNVVFEPIDAVTLKVTLPTAYSPFAGLVSKPIFQSGLRGFGPYKVANIRLHGDNISYLKLLPVQDTKKKALEFRFYTTESEAITAFKLGEIDTLEDLSFTPDKSSLGPVNITQTVKYNRIISVFFNLANDMLKEKNIRHGLAYAIPNSKEELATGPIPKTSWSYTDKVKKYTYDKKQAKQLLSDVVSSSQSAKLTITTFQQYSDLASAIAKSWTEFGVATSVKVVNALPLDYQVLVSAQEVPPDPDQYMFWHQTQTQANITQYNNVKIDKLLEDGRQELDLEKRKKIYADFQRRIVEDAPAIFLMYAKTYTIQRR